MKGLVLQLLLIVSKRATERSFLDSPRCDGVAELGPPSCCFLHQAFDQQSLDSERMRRDLLAARSLWKKTESGFGTVEKESETICYRMDDCVSLRLNWS
jgi:hypothetical protein